MTDEQFWQKVAKQPGDGCWLWTGTKGSGKRGEYGRVRIGALGVFKVHRYAYEVKVGPIPVGLCVLHRCDVPACVRPEHLFLGTHADNIADMTAKGRSHWPGVFTPDTVREVRARHAAGESYTNLAREYRSSASHVCQVVTRKCWKSI